MPWLPLSQAAFGVANEALTHRLRHMCFQKMLQQDIGWYDMDENALSVLMARYLPATLFRGINLIGLAVCGDDIIP
jgi:hypothetical protein